MTRKQGDVQIQGFNPSAEEADEGTDEAVESGVDIVMNHRLVESYAFGDKKSYTLYLKDYMKKLVDFQCCKIFINKQYKKVVLVIKQLMTVVQNAAHWMNEFS